MYIHICIYVYVYMPICIYMLYICTYVLLYVYIHVCTYIYIHISTYVYIYVCVLYAYICMSVCICVHLFDSVMLTYSRQGLVATRPRWTFSPSWQVRTSLVVIIPFVPKACMVTSVGLDINIGLYLQNTYMHMAVSYLLTECLTA